MLFLKQLNILLHAGQKHIKNTSDKNLTEEDG